MEPYVPDTAIAGVMREIVAYAAARWVDKTPGLRQTIDDAVLHSPERKVVVRAGDFQLQITRYKA